MKILLSTIPSDSHTWNLVYIQLLLEELGHQVINLGSCMPIDLLQELACKHQPDIIVISSINGHGNIEGVNIAQAIHANERIKHIRLVIGGKLGTQGDKNPEDLERLTKAGFDGVFSGENTINHFVIFMQRLSDMLRPCIKAVA